MTDDLTPVASAARALVAELANAARAGALTPEAAQSYAGRLHRELNTLADIEAAMGDVIDDHITGARLIACAIASGQVATLNSRRRA